MEDSKYILLTIDVEDWFQVENFKTWIPFETWNQRELRVERNVHRLLDLFDSIELNTQRNELNQPNQHSQPNQPSNNSESYLYDNQQPTTNNSHASAFNNPTPNQQHTNHNKQQTTYDKPTKNSPKGTFFVLG